MSKPAPKPSRLGISQARENGHLSKPCGPHKPTLDGMCPRGLLSIPNAGTVRTIDVPTEQEKKARRGRPRKTGRPGQ